MGKKNDGSFFQQNKKLMREIFDEWNSKYRQEMRDDVYGKFCHFAETDILYYKRKDGKVKLDGNMIAKMEMESSTLHLYDNVYVQREDGEYMGVIPYAFGLAYQFFARTILEFVPRNNKAFVNPCWAMAKSFLGQDCTIIVPDAKTLIDCLGGNPNYKQLKFFKRRQQVLDHIPSDMTELFPEARSIDRHFILHVGDTNTGKTYEAMQALAAAPSGGYFAPLRLLALEGQEKLLDAGVSCSMLTGEEEDIRKGSTHISCTMEMMDPAHYYDVAVIDEAQMIADDDRGYAWTKGILGCYCPQIHVCMSENALNLIIKMIESCGDTYEVKRHTRNTELKFEEGYFVFPKSVRKNDALVVFSRKDVLAAAAELESAGWKPSVIYGSLPYSARKEEMRRFAEHETNVVVATDAIGMGINMPIHRVVFLKTEKYDGTGVRDLTSPEIKQIAGRSGRRGIFNEGYVSTASKSKMVRKRLEEPYEDLEYAGVQIPDSLFALPMKLSDILAEWMKLKDRGIYRKASNEYRLQMCKWLEKNYPDFSKEAMWGFLCISYDEKNMFLQEEWKNIIGKISRKERIDTGFVPKSISNSGLNECEQYYKYLDLYFSFARTLGYVYEDFRHRLMKEKELTATRIMEKLKEGKRINRKTCRRCGKPLPFLYPYGYCQRCHDEEYYEWY